MSHLLKIASLILGFFVMVLLLNHYGSTDLLVVFLSFAIISPILYLVIDRFVQKNNLLLMKEEALRAELALLKKQINPHFFFNTLNNLYGLAVTGSDRTPEMILKLSDLMRFTIYEGKKDHVFLRDELAYLNNYLELEGIRSKRDRLDLRFETEIDDDLQEVPPLMLIMLLENAIKHGADSKTENAFIHIQLKVNAGSLSFSIKNNFEATAAKRPGIGLTNLKRRLQLCYAGRYHYETHVTDDVYTAELRLEL